MPVASSHVDRVGDGRGVAPVHVQAVGDDADPHAGVGQPPQRLGGPGDGGIVRKMRCSITAAWCRSSNSAGQAPLAEVPRALQGQRSRVDPGPLGDHVAQRRRVVAAHPVEVDPEDEPVGLGHAVSVRRACHTRSTMTSATSTQDGQPADGVGPAHLDRPVEARRRVPARLDVEDVQARTGRAPPGWRAAGSGGTSRGGRRGRRRGRRRARRRARPAPAEQADAHAGPHRGAAARQRAVVAEGQHGRVRLGQRRRGVDHRAGPPTSSTRHTSAATTETTMAMSTRRWGAKPISTVNDSTSGVTSQPLANPSTSTGSPRDSPSTVAAQPALWLCPSTSQNGSPGVAPADLDRGRGRGRRPPPRRRAAGALRAGRSPRWPVCRRRSAWRRRRRPTAGPAVDVEAGVAARGGIDLVLAGVEGHAARRRTAERQRAARQRVGRRARDPHGQRFAVDGHQVGAAPGVERLGQGRHRGGRQADLGDGGGLVDLVVADPVVGRRPGARR